MKNDYNDEIILPVFAQFLWNLKFFPRAPTENCSIINIVLEHEFCALN